MFDRMVDAQKERVIKETFTPEHARFALHNLLDRLDSMDFPFIAVFDDYLRANGRADQLADAGNQYLLDYALGANKIKLANMIEDAGEVMLGSDEADIPSPMRMRNYRKRLVRGLSRSKLSFRERQAAIDKMTDNQFVQAVQKAHQKVKGIACAGPIAGGIGDWLSTMWKFIQDHWLEILQAVASILGIALLFLTPVPQAEGDIKRGQVSGSGDSTEASVDDAG